MGYAMNIFDYIEDGAVQGEQARWSARSPFRPRPDFDLMLVPRTPDWREDEDSRAALERIEAEPWVEAIASDGDEVLLRLDERLGRGEGRAQLEGGEGIEGANADLAAGRRYAVYFWGANTTKALHIGHLRNLAVGHALGAALEQAGARVERRSLICDVGRSMGEAMAGVVHSGRDQQVWPEGEEKSDHFVGACYADYVTAGRAAGVVGGRTPTTAPRTRSPASPRCTTTRPTS